MLTPEISKALDAVRTFFVEVYYHCPCFDEEHARIPPHGLVLEPLLAHAEEVRVYGLPKTGPIRANIAPLARPRRGFTELTVSGSLVRGHEIFWNTGAWARGSVALLCTLDLSSLAEILSFLFRTECVVVDVSNAEGLTRVGDSVLPDGCE